MKVILHIGAHRCATTSFQGYLGRKERELSERGMACIGPKRIRRGLFHGIQPAPVPVTGRDPQKRARGRLALHMRLLGDVGMQSVLFTDASMMGRLEENIAAGRLYHGIAERLARYDWAFDGAISDVVMNIRALDTWWASSLSHSLTVTERWPGHRMLTKIAEARRTWRDVVTEVHSAIPGVRLLICPHEEFATRPAAQLSAITGQPSPATSGMFRLNASLRLPHLRASLPTRIACRLPEGNGRWGPFTEMQAASLREAYADDMMWLIGGADGYAELLQFQNNQGRDTASNSNLTRGTTHDPTDGNMAGAG
jgi:hypothetical protein